MKFNRRILRLKRKFRNVFPKKRRFKSLNEMLRDQYKDIDLLELIPKDDLYIFILKDSK